MPRWRPARQLYLLYRRRVSWSNGEVTSFPNGEGDNVGGELEENKTPNEINKRE